MDPHQKRHLLVRTALAYATVALLVVVAGNSGWIPGAEEAHPGLLEHPYRLTLLTVSVVLALSLGLWSAAFGTLRGSWKQGLAALVAGGLFTGAAFSLAPWILYPNDQYSPAFTWVVVGAPLALLTWGAATFGPALGSDEVVAGPA